MKLIIIFTLFTTLVFGQSRQDYIQRYYKLAQSESKKFGIPASILLAQGLLESNAGTSYLAVNANNHFGFKCHSNNCHEGHCVVYSDDTDKDRFIKYNTVWDSWRSHSLKLSFGNYKNLKGSNYIEWAYGLQKYNYASDKNYARKILKVINCYTLTRFDI